MELHVPGMYWLIPEHKAMQQVIRVYMVYWRNRGWYMYVKLQQQQ